MEWILSPDLIDGSYRLQTVSRASPTQWTPMKTWLWSITSDAKRIPLSTAQCAGAPPAAQCYHQRLAPTRRSPTSHSQQPRSRNTPSAHWKLVSPLSPLPAIFGPGLSKSFLAEIYATEIRSTSSQSSNGSITKSSRRQIGIQGATSELSTPPPARRSC